jgi:hypothetical protein
MTEGYYQTPNIMIPLNDRPPGEIAPVALEQLAMWENIARGWPVERHCHDVYNDDGKLICNGQPCWCCADCDKTIWFVNDPSGKIFVYADEEILALKVAHVRQCHAEVMS